MHAKLSAELKIKSIECNFHDRTSSPTLTFVFESELPKQSVEVKFGDWIIKHEDGKYTSCSNDEFRATYEEVPRINKMTGYFGDSPFTFEYTN